MGDIVDLLIFPVVKDGEDLDEVKQKLAKTLSVDIEKVDSWFESEVPTAILQKVDEEVADRYLVAIAKCGAECKSVPTGDKGLSLVAKTKTKNTTLFICPSCEYDEEVPIGTDVEQCPKCGLVLAKWEERMAEEAEKEKIRRRLRRQAKKYRKLHQCSSQLCNCSRPETNRSPLKLPM